MPSPGVFSKFYLCLLQLYYAPLISSFKDSTDKVTNCFWSAAQTKQPEIALTSHVVSKFTSISNVVVAAFISFLTFSFSPPSQWCTSTLFCSVVASHIVILNNFLPFTISIYHSLLFELSLFIIFTFSLPLTLLRYHFLFLNAFYFSSF